MFDEFESSQNAYETAKVRLAEFEEVNDVASLETLMDIEGSINDLNEEITTAKIDLAAQRESKMKAIAVLEKQISDLELFGDSLEDWQSRLKNLDEEKMRLSRPICCWQPHSNFLNRQKRIWRSSIHQP